jgi:CheY-like chemotaxis protein
MKKKLEECCKCPYKLIFIDLNMPIMDGKRMMMRIKEDILTDQMKMYGKSLFVLTTAYLEED